MKYKNVVLVLIFMVGIKSDLIFSHDMENHDINKLFERYIVNAKKMSRILKKIKTLETLKSNKQRIYGILLTAAKIEILIESFSNKTKNKFVKKIDNNSDLKKTRKEFKRILKNKLIRKFLLQKILIRINRFKTKNKEEIQFKYYVKKNKKLIYSIGELLKNIKHIADILSDIIISKNFDKYKKLIYVKINHSRKLIKIIKRKKSRVVKKIFHKVIKRLYNLKKNWMKYYYLILYNFKKIKKLKIINKSEANILSRQLGQILR